MITTTKTQPTETMIKIYNKYDGVKNEITNDYHLRTLLVAMITIFYDIKNEKLTKYTPLKNAKNDLPLLIQCNDLILTNYYFKIVNIELKQCCDDLNYITYVLNNNK